jgi:C2 domain
MLRQLPLQCDLAIGKVTEQWKAGMVELRLSINDVRINGSIDYAATQSNWKKPLPKRYKDSIVRAYIYQCKDLPSVDDDGLADPFVELWSPDNDPSGKKQRTPTVEDNCNPMYFKTLDSLIKYETFESAPPIILNIWDEDNDLLSKNNEFIGRATIFMRDAVYSQDDTIPTLPKWHPIKLGF